MARAQSPQGKRACGWDGLVRQLLPKVYQYFSYHVGDDQAAEDLSAETFERAWISRNHYRPDRGIHSQWIFGIARNVAADYFRRRPPDVSLEAVAVQNADPSAEEVFERQDRFRRLADLLLGLTERERELIALKYGAELTNRAIAGLTGLSESNVGTVLHRTVARLRKQWESRE